jgi:hypothetical protein
MAQIYTARLHSERLLPADIRSRADGQHLVKEGPTDTPIAGARLYAEVSGGEVVGYHAELDGKPVELMDIRTTPAGFVTPDLPPVCYKCMCWPEGCGCWVIDC